MVGSERRRSNQQPGWQLQRQLSDEQLSTLHQLEQFGWELKFVRKPPFQPTTPVVFDGDRRKFAVIERDGSLNENPGFDVRH